MNFLRQHFKHTEENNTDSYTPNSTHNTMNEINVVKQYTKIKWYDNTKFKIDQDICAWMKCLFSNTELATVTKRTERKRADVSAKVETKMLLEKKWFLRKLNDEVDVKMLLDELDAIQKLFEQEDEEIKQKFKDTKDSHVQVDHRNCHTLYPRSAVNTQVSARKNKRIDTMRVQEFYKNIKLVIPTQLDNKKNTMIEMQLDKFLISEKNRLPEVQVVAFMYQICLAVAWLHKNGIVHGDIRCRNIYVFKKKQNWLARLCLAGCGSVIKYVSNGQGYLNIKNDVKNRDMMSVVSLVGSNITKY